MKKLILSVMLLLLFSAAQAQGNYDQPKGSWCAAGLEFKPYQSAIHKEEYGSRAVGDLYQSVRTSNESYDLIIASILSNGVCVRRIEKNYGDR